MLAVVGLGVVATLVGLIMAIPPAPFVIDGKFDDWAKVPDMAVGGPISIQEAAVSRGSTYFHLTLASMPSNGDLVELYIDTDMAKSTGYEIPGAVGAELLVSCKAVHAGGSDCGLLLFTGPDGSDHSGFDSSGRADGAFSGLDAEIGLATELGRYAALVRVATGSSESTSTFLLSELPSVSVEQIPNDSLSATAGESAVLMTLDIGARSATGGPVVIPQLRFESTNAILGPVAPIEIMAAPGGERRLEIIAVPVSDGPAGAALTGVDGDLAVMISGYPGRLRVGPPPTSLGVDGLFDDWYIQGSQPPVPDSADVAEDHLDIIGFSAALQDQRAFFHLSIRDRALAGMVAPALAAPPGTNGPASDLPEEAQPRRGEDIAYVFLDSDLNPLTGYRVADVGADTMLEIRGRGGQVIESRRFVHDSQRPTDWIWKSDETAVEAAAGPRDIEASTLAPTGAKTPLAVRMSDWRGTRDSVDYAMRLKRDGLSSSLSYGAPDGGFDPFAITLSGAFYQSPDGSSWSARNAPAAGAKFVATAMGSGDQRGYAFVLRSDGIVFFTDRATEGWVQYGYGLPPIPGSQAYVGIAAGRGNLDGYIFVLRNDGEVFLTTSGVSGWVTFGYGTPTKPASTGYVAVAAGSEGTNGYVFVLRADGKVYVADRGPSGWTQFGYGSPAIPASKAYIGLAINEHGYVFVLRRDGISHTADRATEGWRQYGYGTPAIPASGAYIGIAAGHGTNTGYLYTLRNDGKVYVTDRATEGWRQYGYGSPAIESATTYVGLASGLDGYIGLLRSDRKMFITDRATEGWRQYGYGTPALTATSPFTSLAAADLNVVFALKQDGTAYRSGDGGNTWGAFGSLPGTSAWIGMVANDLDARVYAIANDGTVYRSPTGAAAWSSWGDAGTDTNWVSIAADQGGWLYSLRRDGLVAYADSTTSTWASKGDAGADDSWISIGARSALGHVYVLGSDRSVMRAPRGNNPAWTLWSAAPGGGDVSWVGIAVDDAYVYALRNDGRVDRAPVVEVASWSGAVGDAGPDFAFVAIATPAAAETIGIAIAAFGLLTILLLARRSRQKCARPKA